MQIALFWPNCPFEILAEVLSTDDLTTWDGVAMRSQEALQGDANQYPAVKM
jgi:hypothetical protein